MLAFRLMDYLVVFSSESRVRAAFPSLTGLLVGSSGELRSSPDRFVTARESLA